MRFGISLHVQTLLVYTHNIILKLKANRSIFPYNALLLKGKPHKSMSREAIVFLWSWTNRIIGLLMIK